MILQIETEIIGRAFAINPDNIFGFVLVIFILAIGYLTWVIKKKESIIAAKDKQILQSSERMHSSLDVIKDKLVDIKNEVEKVDVKNTDKSERIIDLLKRIIKEIDRDAKR